MTILATWWNVHGKRLVQKIGTAALIVVLEYLLTTVAQEES